MNRPRLALSQLLLGGPIFITALSGVLFYVLLEGSREAVIAGSDRLRETASLRVAGLVEAHLKRAERSVEALAAEVSSGALRTDDADALEARLFGEVLADENLAEATITRAEPRDRPDAPIRAASTGPAQVVVERDAAGRIATRVIRRSGDGFIADVHPRPLGGPFAAPSERAPGSPADPTGSLTVRTPLDPRFFGRLLWSDLHWADGDGADVPPERRRIVVTVQKAVKAAGRHVVLRVGLTTDQIDRAMAMRVNLADPADPHRVFLCDARGTLITRIAPGDPFADDGEGGLRAVPAAVPPPVRWALESPALREISPASPARAVRVETPSGPCLATFRALSGTQDWIVGIVVPEAYYLAGVVEARNRLLLVAGVVIAVMLAGAALAVRAVGRGVFRIAGTAERMGRFDFAPESPRTAFRDLGEALEGLERAKTALRAMGKYVPIDLVRELYATGREPVLGGEVAPVTVLFSDIEGFTTIAEALRPADLARALGRYLVEMTRCVHESGGIVDKFIGDAVMALWNAPRPLGMHAAAACRAALACDAAGRALAASPGWHGLPSFRTRFGIHTGEVLVGHFGAPDRLSYTVLGDGVNLAARLEGLNKLYGTAILVSEAVRDAARDAFEFRLVDLVAVKGKTRGVRVYELLGERGGEGAAGAASAKGAAGGEGGAAAVARAVTARAYESALEAYLDRRFDAALAALEPIAAADGPARVLRERCRRFAAEPPPAGWDGTYTATEK